MGNSLKLIIAMIYSTSLLAQGVPKIDTDRPDQTETTSTVPKGWFQLENGFTYIRDKSDNDYFILPSSLWKIGVNDRFELRMITEPQYNRFHTGEEIGGLPPLRFGFKARLIDGKGVIPNISFISHLSIPHLSTDKYKEDYYNLDFRFTLDNDLSEKMNIGYNLGMRWEDGNPEPIFQYTLALGYDLSDIWRCYIELYGDKSQNGPFEIATSGGVYYYFKPNIMFDITPSVGLANTELNYYLGLGFSFLVPMKKSKKK